MHTTDNLPPVPLTLESASLLHQMLRIRWPAWRELAPGERAKILSEAIPLLTTLEGEGSGLFSLLGHKGDLMLVHFQQDFDQLGEVELRLARLRLWDYL